MFLDDKRAQRVDLRVHMRLGYLADAVSTAPHLVQQGEVGSTLVVYLLIIDNK